MLTLWRVIRSRVSKDWLEGVHLQRRGLLPSSKVPGEQGRLLPRGASGTSRWHGVFPSSWPPGASDGPLFGIELHRRDCRKDWGEVIRDEGGPRSSESGGAQKGPPLKGQAEAE